MAGLASLPSRHCCAQQKQTLATPPSPLPEGSGPRLNLWVLHQKQDGGPTQPGP